MLDQVVTIQESKIKRLYQEHFSLLLGLRNLRCRNLLEPSAYKQLRKDLHQKLHTLRRCLKIPFKLVELDITEKRRTRCVDAKGSEVWIDLPLLWGVRLPAKPILSVNVDGFKVQSTVPSPTPEAVKLIKETKGLFDSYELYWVPNDIRVEKIPDPDPILVGVIKPYRFELTRWVDETVEEAWWSKEGY